MTQIITADVAIIGGGIAGLWLLNALQAQGITAILLESNAIGAGQSSYAQGILHSGAKYLLTKQSADIAAMAAIIAEWRQYFAGAGAFDLRNIAILSEQQYLWFKRQLGMDFLAWCAGKLLSTPLTKVANSDLPPLLKAPGMRGSAYVLPELVLDVQSLLMQLRTIALPYLCLTAPITQHNLIFSDDGGIAGINTVLADGVNARIVAQQYVVTAGVGNELLAPSQTSSVPLTQRRPLHMVFLRNTRQSLPDFYAHWLGWGTTPRLTITTHHLPDGHKAWYLGGHLAETGIALSPQEQIMRARHELQTMLPAMGFSEALFGTCRVDRAEPWQINNARPNDVSIYSLANLLIAWPIKLVLAPRLSAQIITRLWNNNLHRKDHDLNQLAGLPKPALAVPPWAVPANYAEHG